MKQCIILAVLLPVTAVAYSQQLPNLDTVRIDQFRKLQDGQRLSKGGLMAGTYSHQTLRGKVYTLRPDNMPCLVPDMKSVAIMPVDGRENQDQINVWPRVKVLPEKGKD